MINAITGRLVAAAPDHVMILTPSGVEYRLEVSSNASERLSRLSGEEKEGVRVLAYLQHREDAMTLFGFYSEEERFCFEQLQTVPGIGARQALKILSGITVENLVKALDAQDVKTLSKVSGVGPKTAQKLVLQLRNVLVLDDEEESASPSAPSQYRDLIESFTQMGFERRAVVRVLDRVLEENALLVQGRDQMSAETLIFPLVLKGLSR